MCLLQIQSWSTGNGIWFAHLYLSECNLQNGQSQGLSVEMLSGNVTNLTKHTDGISGQKANIQLGWRQRNRQNFKDSLAQSCGEELEVWKRATKAMVEKAAINDKEMMIFHTGVVSKLNTTYIPNGHLLGMRYRVALESNGKEFRKLLHIHWNDGLVNYCLLLGKNLHEFKKKKMLKLHRLSWLCLLTHQVKNENLKE